MDQCVISNPSHSRSNNIFHFLAWTTAAVDNERVIGAIPIVMDILNINRVGHSAIELEEKSISF